MNKETVLVAIITLLIGSIGGYWVGSSNQGLSSGDQSYGMTDRGFMGMRDDYNREEEDDDQHGHMDNIGHMMSMWVESEQEFIEEMIPHHQEAVDTAKEVLERGATTPEIRRLVENIIVAQETEIADMKAWYEDWYGGPFVDRGNYEPMMRELENLSGEALDHAFLEDMIVHHMGAIMMARSVQPHIEHEKVAKLTSSIVRTQSEEIVEMREILTGLIIRQ